MKFLNQLAKLNYRWWLPGSLVLGGLTHFNRLGQASIWHDEGYSLMLSPMGPLEILARTARDVHPPLYYLTLHFWMNLFGESEIAVRGISVLFSLLTIIVLFKLVQRLFNDQAARLAAIFLALGPFMVRYAQEARMYAMVAFLLAWATFWLVKALAKDGRPWHYYLYGLVLAAAMYTHYYTVFMVPVHLLYALLRKRRMLWRDRHWWQGNLLAALLFLPWLPAAIGQFTRVQAAFWIPKVSLDTLPSTLTQFALYGGGTWPPPVRAALALILVAAVLTAVKLNRQQRPGLILLASWLAAGPLAVWMLSFARPIYVDRYFVFAAVAFYTLLGVLLSLPRPKLSAWLRWGLIMALLLAFTTGLRSVYRQPEHGMRGIGAVINHQFQTGDELVSGELYSYFDFSYYNATGELLKLLAPGEVSGYGESSLLYDRAEQIVVKDYADLRPASGFVWVIGKSGQHDYFEQIPLHWIPVGERYTSGYSAAQKYRVR